jgi:hypothetical protein
MEMEQTRQRLREMQAVREALISRRELKEGDAYYAKMKPLRAHLLVFMRQDIKADQEMMLAWLEDKLAASQERMNTN